MIRKGKERGGVMIRKGGEVKEGKGRKRNTKEETGRKRKGKEGKEREKKEKRKR